MIEHLPSVDDPQRALEDAGLLPSAWSAPPHTHFATHSHPRNKRLFVRSGEISFNGELLRAPAAVRITAGTAHEAEVGPLGVECVEAFE
ncbi:MAG TPA: cupin [Candidatus Dormibacteraeota bacterium]|nr:cupin [Candidatus Dormibacteraeota bacterium]